MCSPAMPMAARTLLQVTGESDAMNSVVAGASKPTELGYRDADEEVEEVLLEGTPELRAAITTTLFH